MDHILFSIFGYPLEILSYAQILICFNLYNSPKIVDETINLEKKISYKYQLDHILILYFDYYQIELMMIRMIIQITL